MSRVKVFILRHGEREDEAFISGFYREQERIWNEKPDQNISFHFAYHQGQIPAPPKVDSLDPLLTAKGHMQAHHSFNGLVQELGGQGRGRKVAIFSSPLRRAIGTALMVGSISSNHVNGVSWPPPNSIKNDPTNDNNSDDVDDDDSIPITVLNGLGDFASRVYHQGGHAALVPAGHIPCADMASNDGTLASPFTRNVAMMPSHVADCPNENATKPVRFWKRNPNAHKGGHEFVPMSGPICPLTKCFHEVKRRTSPQNPLHREDRSNTDQPDNPLHAVDEAIRLTVARGCDTCIVVAHREAIRDLAQICGYYGSIAHPYCCIGSFDATYERFQPIEYQLSNVWARHDIGRNTPQFLPTSSHDGRSTSNIVFLIPGEVDQFICTIRSRLDRGSLGPQIWLSTKKDARVDPSRGAVRCNTLMLKIVQGHNLWNQYLALLQGVEKREDLEYIKEHVIATVRRKKRCELYGWAKWVLPNGKEHVLKVRVTPRKDTHHGESRAFAIFEVYY